MNLSVDWMPDSEEKILTSQLGNLLLGILKQTQYSYVLMLRYGLIDGVCRSRQEIADALCGGDIQSIRRMETTALNQIRRHPRFRYSLIDFIRDNY